MSWIDWFRSKQKEKGQKITGYYPFDAMEYFEKETGMTIDELIEKNGYTWFQYAIKRDYYWKKRE